MKVTLDWANNRCIVEREPGDPRMHKGGWGAFAESQLLHHVKRQLQKQGHDVIKKRVWKDGHMMGDEFQQYVRARKPVDGVQLAVYSGEYALHDAGLEFNRTGRFEFLLTNLAKEA